MTTGGCGSATSSPGRRPLTEPLRSFLGDPDLVVFEATGPDDVRRVRREVEGRRWAESHGIPTAEVVAKDPHDRWLVSRRVDDVPGESPAYVEAALEVSERIQSLPHPRFATPAATWRARRRSVPLRLARMLRYGIEPRAFAAARNEFVQLPSDTTAHNDFHRDNVLNTSALGHVTVIDWEMASVGPRHHDAVMLIVDIGDASLAHATWRTLVDAVAPGERASLATQLRWLALRTYASDVAVPPREREREKCEQRRTRWKEAQQWADELAGPAREHR